ncbi:hypothetical protein [Desulforhopalus singaporensis]|uniref:Uncharacterized protein n=1 Tax=Desulforhopalus singaporensis TaxID=91360 RepID=A0A1H0VY18_9BACT|nr:hypothetical protein [Desulforhopalus singaporensis]SDP83419.1 hypothetical protein SAMN05660330_04314 [Desulforhopalus singaporensis]
MWISLFVDIRERMGAKVFAQFEQITLEKIGRPRRTGRAKEENSEKLLIDATVTEQAIQNEARKSAEPSWKTIFLTKKCSCEGDQDKNNRCVF